MPSLLLGWIRGTLKQLEPCWAFIADEEERSVCNINKKTSMPGCALWCQWALARPGRQEPRSVLWHEAGGFQRGALSFLPSASLSPVRSSLCISRYAKAQHQPRLADPGQRLVCWGSLSRTIEPDGQNSLRDHGLGWAGAARPPAASLLPRLPPSPSRCRAEALLRCSIFFYPWHAI